MFRGAMSLSAAIHSAGDASLRKASGSDSGSSIATARPIVIADTAADLPAAGRRLVEAVDALVSNCVFFLGSATH